jgi:hypothetical protein
MASTPYTTVDIATAHATLLASFPRTTLIENHSRTATSDPPKQFTNSVRRTLFYVPILSNIQITGQGRYLMVSHR